jgi:hypothetical protein
MAKRSRSAEWESVARHDATVLAIDPLGERADLALDAVVRRHNACARALLAASGPHPLPRGAELFRLLQVRFINLVCRAKGGTRRAVAEAVARRLPIDEVLREALRPFFAEVAAWQPSHGGLPKPPDAYWREAFAGLTADAGRWGRQKKSPGAAQPRHFLIQGADYSL